MRDRPDASDRYVAGKTGVDGRSDANGPDEGDGEPIEGSLPMKVVSPHLRAYAPVSLYIGTARRSRLGLRLRRKLSNFCT